LYLLTILFVQVQELDTQPATLAGITDSRYGDHPVLVWEFESDNHSCAGAYGLLGIDKEATGADIRHISPDAARTAAGVGEFVFDLSRNRGTLEPAPL